MVFMAEEFGEVDSIGRSERYFWFLGELFGGVVGEVFCHEDYQKSLLSALIDVGYDVNRLTATVEVPSSQ
jgi:hypothetical protein